MNQSPNTKAKEFALKMVAIVFLVAVILLVFRLCSPSKPKSAYEIEHTPIQVELIRSLAQLAMVNMEDEVVVDSVEYYKNTSDQILGNLSKLTDPDDFKHGLSVSNVSRRLTLIVQGELNVGFDLKNTSPSSGVKAFRITENDSVILIVLPKAKVLDINTTPSKTRIFQENGEWQDFEITILKNKARRIMLLNVQALKLNERAEHNIKKLLRQMIKKKKKIEFKFV